jgi:uncharacterized membrane protein YbhN (UPF0104 family)
VSALGTLGETFSALDGRLVAVALAFHLANFGFRSLAWRNVLRAAYPDRPVPLLGVAGAYAAGVALNAFTPARGGDLLKVALVRARVRGSSVPTIASTMGVVTLFDLVVGAAVIAVLAGLGLLPALPGLQALPAVPALATDQLALALPATLGLGALVFVLARRFRPRLVTAWENVKAGAAILGTPRRYLTEVAPIQLSAWACRVGAAFFLLAAFGLPATLVTALIVVMVGGLSTVVPTPGGVGTQQVMLAYLLHATATTATVVSFSLGMQAAVTTLNAFLGAAAVMLMFRTLRPGSAIRSHIRAARAETSG